MLTTFAMVAALLITPAGKTVVNIAEVGGQGTPTITVSGTYSCAAGARRLVVTLNDPAVPITYADRVVEQIACPATDRPYRVELTAPGSVWWHRKLRVHADLRDDDTVQAATCAAIDQGTLLAVTADTAERKGGNLVVSGATIGPLDPKATVTVAATQGDIHGEATIPLPANRSYAVPVHPVNAKVFLPWEPIEFTVTAATAVVSGTLTPTRP